KKYKLRSGVGLAAPQINVSKKMLAVYIQDDGKGNQIELQLINPKIVSHSVQKAYLNGGEGCLSVDEAKPGLVHR
ncbi:peptide deformylase, partial [Staphylococcus sp. GDY8P97P]